MNERHQENEMGKEKSIFARYTEDINNEVKSAIAARDKWWVENLQRFLTKDDDGNYYLHPTKEFHEWLQSLKQSLEVKE